jgi:DNA-binding transcriptional LysR family regulator
VAAIDCGRVINPNQVRGQVRGCVVMGASGALMEELTVRDGRVVAGNLEEYLLFTNADTPAIEAIILDRPDQPPSGCGEAPVGPIAPAIGNAFCALTGVRLRQLPMTPERVLAALDGAREAVTEVRELSGGTLSIGMFGTASGFLLSRLVADFRSRHPNVRLRLVGQNSSEVAEDVRRGRLEAGLVVLPVDDEGLELRPVRREEVVYVSRERDRVSRAVTIERLAEAPLILYDAHYGWSDPTRRQLQERAQRAGVQLEPVIEIEDMDAALELTASGLGDTIAPKAALQYRPTFRRLGTTSFAEPLYDDFAFIARRGAPLSPAARSFLELAERRLAEFGEGVLYAGVAGEDG